jgi:hypothetical protein
MKILRNNLLATHFLAFSLICADEGKNITWQEYGDVEMGKQTRLIPAHSKPDPLTNGEH